MKIHDKEFLKIIKATMNDFKAEGQYGFTKELQDILEKRELTLMNISGLVKFIQYRIDNPSHYDLVIKAALSQGEDFEVVHSISQIKKEHKYINKVLSKYFTWEENDIGLMMITKKIKEVA